MQCSKLFRVMGSIAVSSLGFACADSPSATNYSGSSSGTPATASHDYAGPGSAYSIYFDEEYGEFDISVADVLGDPQHTWIDGTFERHDNGFVEFTSVDAAGTLAPSEGDVAIALEAPGFGVVLRPYSEDTELVPTLVTDDCPIADYNSNWILSTCADGGAACDADDTGTAFFGTFEYDFDTDTASFDSRYDIESATDQGSATLATATCANGIMQTSDTAVYLNQFDGGVIVHESTDDSDETRHAFGLPQEDLDLELLDGTYVGMAFDKASDTTTVLMMYLDSGDSSAHLETVAEDELDAANGATLNNFGDIDFTGVNEIDGTSADGWLTATLTAPGGGTMRPLYCTASTGVGDDRAPVILCVGQSLADAEEYYNLMFVGGYYD